MQEPLKFTESELHLQEMRDLSLQMKEILLKGEVKQFGDLLHKAWEVKKASNQNVTTPIIDQCYDSARERGALGGKLLGAGQCGYMLIYASPRNHVRIVEDLLELGCHREPLRFTENGLEVWSAIR